MLMKNGSVKPLSEKERMIQLFFTPPSYKSNMVIKKVHYICNYKVTHHTSISVQDTEMLQQLQHPRVTSFQNDMGDLIISSHKPTNGHSNAVNLNTCLVFQTLASLVHLFKMQWLGSSLIFL